MNRKAEEEPAAGPDTVFAPPPSGSAPPASGPAILLPGSGSDRRRPLFAAALSLCVHLGVTGAFLWQRSAARTLPVKAAEPVPVLVTLPPLSKAPPRPPPPGPKPASREAQPRPAPWQAAAVAPLPLQSAPALHQIAPPDLAGLDRLDPLPGLAPPPSTEEGRESFEGLLLARIEQFRHYPTGALRQHRQGTVQVRFRMDRNGQVLEAAVQESSGVKLLDRESLATVFRAQPLPPIPRDRPDVMTIIVPVEFRLSDEGRRARVQTASR